MIADTSHKLILFADDLILYVLNHKSVFPSILKKIKQFGHPTTFNNNPTQSQCLNVFFETSRRWLFLKTAFPFGWVPNLINT